MGSIADDIFASRHKPLPRIIKEAKDTLERAAKFINKVNSKGKHPSIMLRISKIMQPFEESS